MRINSVPDIKCFCKNKNVLCVQSMVWHFVRHPVYTNQRDAQILVNNINFFVKWLYMFRTIISPSSGATFNKLYSAIGVCR